MKVNHKIKLIVRVFVIFYVLFMHINTLMAVAFPFREFEEGDPVPEVTLSPHENGQLELNFSGLKGAPFIAVFWGADLKEKAERSVKILAEVESLTPFLMEKNVQRLSVNVQNDETTVINEVVSLSNSTIDVYQDKDRKAYAALGIFVMPTVLLVDKDGNAAAGLGYSRDLVDRLKGAVEIMLGEKTPEQVAAELRPEMKETSNQEKASRRHFNFGIVMMKRGQVDAAIREFAKAVEIDPGMGKAHLQLGCLYLGRNELENAEVAINKAIKADPGSVIGKICRGELLRLKGQLEEAAKELQAVIESNNDEYDAYYYQGRVFEDQDKDREAMEMFKKAYEIILKHSVAGK